MTWFTSAHVGQQIPHPVFTPTPPKLSDPSGGDPHFSTLVPKRQDASDAEFYATLASQTAIKTHGAFDVALHGSFFAPGLDQAEAAWLEVFTLASAILSSPVIATMAEVEFVKVTAQNFQGEATAHMLAVKALRTKVLAAQAAPPPPTPAPAPAPGPAQPGPVVTLPGQPGPLPQAPTPIPVPTEGGDKTVETVGWLAAAGAVVYLLSRIFVR